MFDVVSGRLENGGRLLVEEIVGETARSDLFSHGREQLVAQSDIAERATYHDLMVASTGTIGVEVLRFDAAVGQVFASRTGSFERAGRRNMVGGHGITEQREHAGAMNVFDGIRSGLHAIEERLLTHIGGILIPCEQFAFRNVKSFPTTVAFEYGSVILQEHLTADGTIHHGSDFAIGGPDILQIHIIAVRILAKRLGFKIKIHGACERIGDDERRGCQIVHLDVRADAAFEIAVARQH